jgi:lipopolysaccharide transport system ATP-binding protein
MRPIISVTELGKKYRLGTGQPYKTLRETIMNLFSSPARVLRGNGERETIWALKDVSFEVNKGEVLGIIGRNGAGKSTLLKILSRITEPTEGEIRMRGRAASLLEVGAGFHPELTGRENIYLNGAILGMTRAEINRKFDEIVAFAEIEKFLDTPVKRYSSGMYVRLAFAVAAHLEPEILIIDEVLAVGDAQFQKKCLGKMGEVSKEGRTVLFVSHNMDAINVLCNRTIVVNSGNMVFDGGTEEGINVYLASALQGSLTVDLSDPAGRYVRSGQRRYGQITAVSSINREAVPTGTFEMGKAFAASLVLRIKERVSDPEVGFCISTVRGTRLHHFISTWEKEIDVLDTGTYRFTVCIDKIMLYPGTYTLTVWFKRFSTEGSDDFIEAPLSFKVIKSGGLKPHSDFSDVVHSGGVYVKSKWDVEELSIISAYPASQ